MTAADLLKKHTCEIAEDLLPFYAEDTRKPPSTADHTAAHFSFAADNMTQPAMLFVEEHIKCCESCRSLLEMMTEDWDGPKQIPPTEPAIRFRRKYQVRLALGMAFAILTAAGILAFLL